MRGRKPKPTALKLLDGTLADRRRVEAGAIARLLGEDSQRRNTTPLSPVLNGKDRGIS